ncbi:galactose-6-sulfurylase [Malassezia japonica]|uniref:Protein farnesyltransferase/geranylgeranyltransferase type-1 subunit alpha n=1 Tax=Malassezia japonica TaxID=223818 RepID=A0AAF0F3Z6_9BASI|nr:galactose-6-sulfurylase [Malassezia japonica]WFD40400.1 galactose-6-sulfurylase [Malassezia japonica]
MVAIAELQGDDHDMAAQESVWADVTPVPQVDGPEPLCPIMYDPDYTKAMDLFRALKQMRPNGVEASERALALTEHLIYLNPANYSVWQYRAQVLLEMAASDASHQRLRDELDFMDEFAQGNMKNYQIWQHRRVIVSVLGDPSRELAFTSTVLDLDSKNYHTWAYRQWVLAHFGGLHKHDNKVEAPGAGAFPALWDGELAYVDNMLEADVRNNSAYNHRWFCVWGRLLEGRIVPPELEAKRQEEIDYALNKIAVAPNNASPWNYLRGVCTALTPRVPMHTIDGRVLSYIPQPDHERAAQQPEVDEAGKTPAHALEWLLDSAAERIKAGDATLRPTCSALLARLAHADPARTKYWQFRQAALP